MSLQQEASDLEASQEGRKLAVAMAKVAWDTKGEDIVVLDVAAQASWCRYMVFVTVFSRPQLNAILGKMEKEAREAWGRKTFNTPGRSAWEVLDLGDVVVRITLFESCIFHEISDLQVSIRLLDNCWFNVTAQSLPV